MRLMADTADKYRDGVPLQVRFGLYQGKSMSAAAEDAYFREMKPELRSGGGASSGRAHRGLRHRARTCCTSI